MSLPAGHFLSRRKFFGEDASTEMHLDNLGERYENIVIGNNTVNEIHTSHESLSGKSGFLKLNYDFNSGNSYNGSGTGFFEILDPNDNILYSYSGAYAYNQSTNRWASIEIDEGWNYITYKIYCNPFSSDKKFCTLKHFLRFPSLLKERDRLLIVARLEIIRESSL